MGNVIRNPLMTLMMLVMVLICPESADASGWSVNPAGFRYDMSLYFELSFKSTDVPTDFHNYEVASFVDNDCRGISEIMPDVENCMYMRIRSNSQSGETVTFKLRDKISGKTTVIEGVSIDFESGKAIGLPSDPYRLTVENYYNVTVTSTEGGSVDMTSGRFPEGTEITVTATPDENFRFVRWSDGVTQPTRTVRVDSDIELRAMFERDVFTLTYIIDGEVFRTVSLQAGARIDPEPAPAKEGYEFDRWDGLPETMPARDLAVTAVYTRYYNVTVTSTEGGSVDMTSGRFPEGTEITVTATPDENFRFVRWSDGVTQPTRTVRVDSDIELRAMFERDVFTLTYIIDGEVFRTVSLQAGARIDPEPAPAKEGYEFDRWDGLPETMPARDLAVTAVYTRYYSVTVTSTEGGSVDLTSGRFPEGTEITVTAAPDRKFRFVRWSDGMTQPARTVRVDSDIELQAVFERYLYTLTYVVDGDVLRTMDLEAGTRIDPEPAPSKEGHEFDRWEGLPETMPASDLTVTAVYTRYYNVTVTSTEGGSVDMTSGRFPEGTEITVTATPDVKFRFVGWSDGVTQPARTVRVDSDLELCAVFEQYVFTLTYIVDGDVYKSVDLEVGARIDPVSAPYKEECRFDGWEGLPETMPARDLTVTAVYTRYYNVSISSTEGGSAGLVSGRFAEGTKITVTATPWDRFRFVTWSDGETQPTRTITVDSDIELQAVFERYLYTLTYVVDGDVLMSVDLEAGAPIVPESAPDKEGYEFEGWDGLPAAMPARDLTVTAIYKAVLYSLTVYLDGELYLATRLAAGTPIEIPEPLTPDGRVFDGWQEDVPATMPCHDLEIHGTTSVLNGIRQIFADGDRALTVYDLHGRLILSGASISEVIDRLPHGIYIINGVRTAL